MEMLCKVLTFIYALQIGGISSQSMKFSGDTTVDKTYGENVTITWNITANVDEDIILKIFVGGSNGTRVFQDIVTTVTSQQNKNLQLHVKTPLNFKNRIFARYISEGKIDSNGQVIGKVLLTIINLTFIDSASYLITANDLKLNTISKETVLTIYSTCLSTSGDRSLNGTFGGNANVKWKVQGFISKNTYLNVSIYLNDTNSKHLLYSKYGKITQTNELDDGEYIKLSNRSSASYNYTGKHEGNETGEITFTIRNLTFNDEGSYILTNFNKEIARTNLNVYSTPSKCGIGLQQNYTVKHGKVLEVEIGFCGKPKPSVSCGLNNETFPSIRHVKKSQQNYTYTVRILSNIQPMEREELVCTAKGYLSNSSQKAMVIGECDSTCLTSSGDSLLNESFAGNATIMWKVQGSISKNIYLNLSIYFNGTNSQQLLYSTSGKMNQSDELNEGAYKKLFNRSSAYYKYTGKQEGNETGEITFTIRNLTFNDEGSYILTNSKKEIGKANLIVYSFTVRLAPASKCGVALKQNYTVKTGKAFHATIGFCGKPKPSVSCTLNNKTFTSKKYEEVSPHNYIYTVTIMSNIQPKVHKELVCTAQGYQSSISREAIVVGDCDSTCLMGSGESSLNESLGRNASIMWKVQGSVSNNIYLNLSIYLNGTNSQQLLYSTTGRMNQSDELNEGVYKKLFNRSSAYYKYTGKREGNETGEITFTIRNLTFNDAGFYTLANSNKEIARANLIVYSPASKCGVALKQNYTVKTGEVFNVRIGFCGKPKPTVSCILNNEKFTSANHVVEDSPYNYTYSVTITSIVQPKEKKELVCTAQSYRSSVSQKAFVVGDCDSTCLMGSGDSSLNKRFGGNATILWKVQGSVKKDIDLNLTIYLNERMEQNGRNSKHFLYATIRRMNQSGDLFDLKYTKLFNRSSAYYKYTGKHEGNETGEIIFTIRNLTFNAEGSYVLTNFNKEIARANLNVYSPPSACGLRLHDKYNVKNKRTFDVTIGFCGKPQPNVSCILNGEKFQSINSTAVSRHNYTYTVRITSNVQPCERKELICTARGYQPLSVSRTAVVVGNFAEAKKRFIGNITFSRDIEECGTISWKKIVKTGECGVCYQLEFLDSKNAIISKEVTNRETFKNCSQEGIVESDSVRIKSFVGDFNTCGSHIFSNNSFHYSVSEIEKVEIYEKKERGVTPSSKKQIEQPPDAFTKYVFYVFVGVGGLIGITIIVTLIVVRRKKGKKRKKISKTDVNKNTRKTSQQHTFGHSNEYVQCDEIIESQINLTHLSECKQSDEDRKSDEISDFHNDITTTPGSTADQPDDDFECDKLSQSQRNMKQPFAFEQSDEFVQHDEIIESQIDPTAGDCQSDENTGCDETRERESDATAVLRDDQSDKHLKSGEKRESQSDASNICEDDKATSSSTC